MTVTSILPAAEHDALFRTRIVPTWTKAAVTQPRPVAVVVIGQPGSGKTTAATLARAALDQRGGAVHAASDDLKELHPHYQALLSADEQAAGPAVRSVVRSWQEQLEDLARAEHYDVVAEHAPTDADAFTASLRHYRAAGYRVELVAVAAPQARTQLGLAERFLAQTCGDQVGRYVSWDNHDACTQGVLDALEMVEREELADRITVLNQSGHTLYDSCTEPGRWPDSSARHAVRREHRRPWTAAETHEFHRRHAQALRHLGGEQVPEARRLAIAAAVERAAALADGQRRTAQIRSGRRGVDFHKLSADEHAWTYDELIWPAHEPLVRPQEHPVAVFVIAQPGAGKTQVSTTVQRALRARGGALWITADGMKGFHPDHDDLIRSHPRSAGSLIRADVKAWQARLEEAVRERRGDVTIDTAPADPHQLLRSAALYHRAGYRVEFVVMAVRAADSRQGTAERAATHQEMFDIGRFTTAAGHDACYDGVAAAVHLAESHPAVHALHIVARDQRSLWHNEQLPDGTRLRPARAGWVLAAERLRPYTDTEARAFLARQRRLRATLPQYRADLDEIDALARPLLPEHLRPARLTATGAASALLLPLPRGYRDSASYSSR